MPGGFDAVAEDADVCEFADEGGGFAEGARDEDFAVFEAEAESGH